MSENLQRLKMGPVRRIRTRDDGHPLFFTGWSEENSRVRDSLLATAVLSAFETEELQRMRRFNPGDKVRVSTVEYLREKRTSVRLSRRSDVRASMAICADCCERVAVARGWCSRCYYRKCIECRQQPVFERRRCRACYAVAKSAGQFGEVIE